jgi:hypothetical protein
LPKFLIPQEGEGKGHSEIRESKEKRMTPEDE